MEITITFTEEEIRAIRISLMKEHHANQEKMSGKKAQRISFIEQAYEKILDACVKANNHKTKHTTNN